MSDAAEKDEKVTTIWIAFAPDEVDALRWLTERYGAAYAGDELIGRLLTKLNRATEGGTSEATRPR